MKMATKMLLMRSGGDQNRSEQGGNQNRAEQRGNETRYEMRGNENRYEMRNENRGEMRNEMRNEMRGEGYGNEMRQNENRYEMGGNQMEGNESRFRDRRGREHYDNGRYAPMRNEMNGEQERRFEYTEKRNEYRGDNEQRSEMRTPYVPPYFAPEPQQRRIGFALEGENYGRRNEVDREYRAAVDIPQMHEMDHRGGGQMEKGHAESKQPMPFTRQTADEWMNKLKNEDGTRGPHWPFEKTKQVMMQKGIDCDPVEFYAAMNIMYSDYSKVAKTLGMNTVDFYVEMAKAFLDDKDVGPGKIAKYYEFVVGG